MIQYFLPGIALAGLVGLIMFYGLGITDMGIYGTMFMVMFAGPVIFVLVMLGVVMIDDAREKRIDREKLR